MTLHWKLQMDGIRVISDGILRLDGGPMFGVVPKPVWSRYVKPEADNTVPCGMNCLLVELADGWALIEAGSGDVFPDDKRYGLRIEGARLPDGLAAANVDRGEVRWVVLSHLHFDHAGWIAVREGERIVPMFPNAKHVVQQRELDDAANPAPRNRASYVANQWRTISDAGQWHLVEGDAEICDGIRVVQTGGHCPGHQMVLIERGGTRIVFLADICSGWIHLRPAWTTAYDALPDETFRVKLEWLERILAENWIAASYHDPRHALARLERGPKGHVLARSVT